MLQAAGGLLGKQNTPEREPAFKEIIPYRGDNSLMHSNRSFARQQSDLEKVVSSALVSLRRRSLDQKEKKKRNNLTGQGLKWGL